MNYEILSKLAMEETDKLKSEKLILAKRNDILHMEIETLKKMIRELQADKEELTKEVESLKSVLEFKEEEKKQESFSYYS
jgi:succinate dehydrogenase/fumarate reductase-like Fe-S protein